jgi:hypothetical protein
MKSFWERIGNSMREEVTKTANEIQGGTKQVFSEWKGM